MILTINQFCKIVNENIDGLVGELLNITGRNTPEERKAWYRSLPELSKEFDNNKLNNKNIGNLHVSVGQLSLEYKLPSAAAWCDVVFLGRGLTGPSQAVIVELKHWDTFGDQPGDIESHILHNGELTLHPSEQVKGYTNYCQKFHSTVIDHNAKVHGCVYFTTTSNIEKYRHYPS